MRSEDERPTSGAPSDWPERPLSRDAPLPEAGAIPGYRLIALIHRGGQGAVYRALQLSTGREVAVKILPGGLLASDVERRRFERECDLVALLDHPHVVSLIDSGETRGQAFLAMRLVEGEDLDAWVARAEPAVADRLRVFLDACDGVAHAHQRGVIHRDLKPRNIRIDAAGQAHVLDFGLGKPLDAIGDAAGSSLTMDGHFIGTLAFAAPEQLSGDHARTDVRTDVHALGLILYWLLTGRMPYAVTGDLADVTRAVQAADPEPPRRHVPGLDLDLQTIVLKALAKDPDRRYQTVDALAADVRRHLAGEAIDARRDSRWYVLSRTARRHRGVVASALAIVLVLVAGIVAVIAQRDEARRQEARAEEAAETAVRALSKAKLEAARAVTEARSAERISRLLAGMLRLTSDIPGPPGDVTVAQMLDRARDKLLPEVEDEPLVRGRIALALAMGYRTVGRYPDAMKLFDQLTALADSPDAPPVDRMEAARFVAMLVKASRDNAASEPHHRRAVEMARELDGELPPTMLPSCLGSHGLILLYLERFAEATPLIEEAWRLARERAPDDLRFMAEMTERLGDLRRNQGREAEAFELRQEARELYTQHVGGPSAQAATSLAVDSGVLWGRGEFSKAEALARESLAIFSALEMDEHVTAAQALNALGLALREQRRFDEAKKAFHDALRIFRKGAGEGHVTVQVVLTNLAELEDARGDAAAARTAWARVESWEAEHGQ